MKNKLLYKDKLGAAYTAEQMKINQYLNLDIKIFSFKKNSKEDAFT